MPRAVSLVGELLSTYEPEVESISIHPSDGGRFEVSANGKLLYSKLETHRHPEPGEISRLVREYLADLS